MAGTEPNDKHATVSLATAVRTWAAIALQTFGGPAGQIAVMQRVLVDEKRWLGQRRFLHALNYCMLLPGPEAQQLAVYTGWLLNGTLGGVLAGTLFVLPGVLVLLALSVVYVAYGETTIVTAMFAGLAPAVLAIVAQALVRLARRALAHPALLLIAIAAFLALFAFAIPFPLVVGLAALAGWLLHRWSPHAIGTSAGAVADDGPAPLIPDDALHHERPSWRRSLRVIGIGLVLWATPVVLVASLTGIGSVFTSQGLFFSGTAVITFGGAYAVLAFVAQRAVEVYGWLTAGDMVRGLSLAETTPGPLIMVVQFVAFLGAFHNPGALDPWLAGVLGALLTTWVTFVPSFLFVLLGAPYIEQLRRHAALSAALTGITAAVVGVIANLAAYFANHTLFGAVTEIAYGPLRLAIPELASARPLAFGIAVLAFGMVFGLRWSIPRVLLLAAGLGLVAGMVGIPVN
ncbi:chromate transporter [Tamaricihabitans halophyticus]|uniref:Chromate transporter n=1 Tax=Tamaricihabitans halophyticus TaxID=1262583 RepID=A0A4R2QCR9_9PSEU|nr:chromate efflux transporter [Tamaricihabitans halophyticus]TCP46823.1 chromate transporter [Tamaricihabitans halophyticus]